ncbi:MAG: [Fe-Fe] hydrogenase large subunit C-terminal domain-containing protein [Bacteroidales bacterium]
MMDFQIEVNNKQIDVREGESLLTALTRNGIKVPTLCHMNRFSPTGACRLCVVEVEGKKDLVTSCSSQVEKGMKVRTNSQRVLRSRKSLVELLLSNHPDDCLYCLRNGHCELQSLAEEMNIKERKYYGEKKVLYPDYSSPSVARDPAKCVLCSRCVRMCEEVQLVTALDFISRGNKTTVNSAFNKGLNVSTCIHCGQCIQVCPTAALIDISHLEKVQTALGNQDKMVVFHLSPSAGASVAAELKMKSRKLVMERISSALKRCGASKVFNLGFASDINVLEEASILKERLEKTSEDFPVLSSCCPSWVRYVEDHHPEILEQLAPVKSPQQIMGAMVKTIFAGQHELDNENIFNVSVMPCAGNKYESSREENTHKGVSEIDAVLTVRELFQLLRSFGLDLAQMNEEALDKPYNEASSVAWKHGYSGGKAEAVAEQLFYMMGDSKKEKFRFNPPKNMTGRRETKLTIGGKQVGFAWVSSIAEAENYLQHLKQEGRDDIHYVEVMACLDGCVGGGGQPISRGFEMSKSRKKVCVEMEKSADKIYARENLEAGKFFSNGRLRPGKELTDEWLKTVFVDRTSE